MREPRPAGDFSERIQGMVKELRAQAPDCVAAGVVDMATGMLLAYETLEEHPSEVLDLLAGATLDLFQGRTVVMIEDVFKERRGVRSDRHYFQEVLINSEHVTHLFLRMLSQQDVVAVIVCRKSVNVGMLFAQSRRVVAGYAAT
ncbi:hypothetical protein [Actinocorallia populi]|uniref:hypothetical protein n=1 Tax=Actinocorallia populi TaxID=2079200 RepID=UPI000D08CB46|nr:hypothetical protein [Actinocorallia populi]